MSKKFEPSFSDKMKKEEEFFNNRFLMSYSGLSKLLYSPDLFYRHYILNQRDDTQTQTMLEGSILHCLLLTPERFNDEYIISMEDVPSDNIIKLMKHLLEFHKEKIRSGEITKDDEDTLEEYGTQIFAFLEEINLYQKMKDESKINKIINDKGISYWNFLKKAEGKTIIDAKTFEFIQESVEKIKTDPKIMELMGFFADSMNGITTSNEAVLVKPIEYFSFDIRGIIDNLVFDPTKKEIRINDLKRSQKTLSTIEDTIKFYKYWIQASMYKDLVEHIYGNDPKYKGWSIVFRFIVVDSYGQAAPIRVSAETMLKWDADVNQLLSQADFHFTEKNFKMPYSFLSNDGELVL